MRLHFIDPAHFLNSVNVVCGLVVPDIFYPGKAQRKPTLVSVALLDIVKRDLLPSRSRRPPPSIIALGLYLVSHDAASTVAIRILLYIGRVARPSSLIQRHLRKKFHKRKLLAPGDSASMTLLQPMPLKSRFSLRCSVVPPSAKVKP